MQLFALLAAALLAVLFIAVASARGRLGMRASPDRRPLPPLGRPVRGPVRKPERTPEHLEDTEFAEELAPQVTTPAVTEYSVPSRYGDNRVALMVRDPNWLYAYWEVQPEWQQARSREDGVELMETVPVLRLYDITGGQRMHQDIRLTDQSDSWYLGLATPAHTYYAEIGRLSRWGRFVPMARSNVVLTPPAGVSDAMSAEWPPIGWTGLYGGAGPSSPEFVKTGNNK
ncbi:MAG: DUF4912 domain-containing protein [Firmicutes bacterium]|nr:DUF4912 domain-containing protein [Bacillota bacterium]